MPAETVMTPQEIAAEVDKARLYLLPDEVREAVTGLAEACNVAAPEMRAAIRAAFLAAIGGTQGDDLAARFPKLAGLMAEVGDDARATVHIGPETMQEFRALFSPAGGLIPPAVGLIPTSSSGENVRRFLDLSTCHLTAETRETIENHGIRQTVYDHPDGYGWLVHVPYGEMAEEDPDYPEPDDFKACLEMARARHCDYILFDADGPDCEGLESFEDDEGEDETADKAE